MEQAVGTFTEALKSGNWWLAISAILMILSGVANRLSGYKIPKKYMPWISIALGIGTQMAGMLATGAHWADALASGVMMGLAASGLYSAGGKVLPVIGKKAEEGYLQKRSQKATETPGEASEKSKEESKKEPEKEDTEPIRIKKEEKSDA